MNGNFVQNFSVFDHNFGMLMQLSENNRVALYCKHPNDFIIIVNDETEEDEGYNPEYECFTAEQAHIRFDLERKKYKDLNKLNLN